jgi:hypothetical protein
MLSVVFAFFVSIFFPIDETPPRKFPVVTVPEDEIIIENIVVDNL